MLDSFQVDIFAVFLAYIRNHLREFSGGLVFRTWRFHCCGPHSVSPWFGNWDPHLKLLHTMAKKKKKKKRKLKINNIFTFLKIFIVSIIIAVQYFVHFLLHSKVTQLHIHIYILFFTVFSIVLHHKWLDIVPYTAGSHCLSIPNE